MPQIDFSPENRLTTLAVEFDKLKLEKDEKARGVLLEYPTFAWTHVLRAPKIVDGRPVKIMKQRRARKGEVEGDRYEDYDMDFIGGPLCLGDLAAIKDKGSDPDNCPACRASRESEHIPPPERRFAVNLIRYATNRDGKVITPFSCGLIVWRFPERMFNSLTAINTEYEASGGIRGKDLILTCVSSQYQTYEIMIGGQNVWAVNDEIKTRVLETYRANRIEDLEATVGRRVNATLIADDVRRVRERWADVERINSGYRGPDVTAAADTAALGADLNRLLATANGTPALTAPATTAPAPTSAPPATPGSVDLAALLGVPVPAIPAPTPQTAVPAQAAPVDDLAALAAASAAPAPAPPAPSAVPDIADLLGSAAAVPAQAPPAPSEAIDFEALMNEFQEPQKAPF